LAQENVKSDAKGVFGRCSDRHGDLCDWIIGYILFLRARHGRGGGAGQEAARPDPVVAPSPDPAPAATSEPELQPEPEPEPKPQPEPEPERVVLPTIKPDAPVAQAAMPPVSASAPMPAPEDLPAVVAYATPFSAPQSVPLFSILLYDDPEFPLTDSTLQSLTVPVSIVIDPTRMDAEAQLARYRAAGIEAVIEARFGDLAAFEAALDRLPQTVALLDSADGTLRGDISLQGQVLARMGETGHGLIAVAFGLGGLEQASARDGVPAARLYRVLDDEGQSAPVMLRLLDRAAFEARQTGSAIVLGRSYPETLAALLSWGAGQAAVNASYAVAPVSAILQQTLAR